MPAASESEAYENLTKAQKFAQFMYPNYTSLSGNTGARTVSQGPLLRMKVMNLLQTTKNLNSNTSTTSTQLYSSYGSGGDGMLGFCSDVTFNFNLEGDHGVFQKADGVILPKLIEVSIGGFNPIHEHHLGWDENNLFSEQSGSLFPYGAQADQQTIEDSDPFSSQTEEDNEVATANVTAERSAAFDSIKVLRVI